MKRLLMAMCFFCFSLASFAQEPAKTEDSKPNYWKKGVVTTLGFSQLSLTNWAAGGYGQLTLNTFADVYANYAKDKVIWNNELQAGYGFIQSFETGFKKSDDRLIIDSKVGYKAIDKLYFSAVYNFRSQFAKGYEGKNVVSDILAPANTSLGLGIDYTPDPNFSINIAPLTGKAVIVKIPELRTKYGNAADQSMRFELGAQVKMDGKVEVEGLRVTSSLLLFSDYLNKPQNIKITWDANVTAKISKYFSVTLMTNLLYDDKVKSVQKKTSEGETVYVTGVQFKELFSIGLTYTFGQSK